MALLLPVGSFIMPLTISSDVSFDTAATMRGRRPLSSRAEARFIDGFVTASLVFCIGPLAFLGSLNDGLGRGAEQLFLKSGLDFFAAMAFAASLGIGVAASAITVALLQGSLTLVGWLLGDALSLAQIDALTVAGGVILGGLSLRLLALKDIRVADMLPGLFIAPIAVWAVGLVV